VTLYVESQVSSKRKPPNSSIVIQESSQSKTSIENTMTAASNDVVEQLWRDLVKGDTSVEEGLIPLSSHLKDGWTTDQATQQRELDGSFNVVKPPVDCPAWLCIILPCIKHIPSMKAFSMLKPDDAEVLRNGKWTRYDASSLVTGDVIRLEEGDMVPADCVVTQDGDEDLLVDLQAVTGEERPKSIDTGNQSLSRSQRQLYLGGRVVQGRATAVVTSVGPRTLLAKLIQDGRFPPKEPILEASMDTGGSSNAGGIQLGNMS
jgi:magnesium-transporting ATPase (P-type)